MGWHSLEACQFVILRQVRYGTPDLLRGYVLGTVHYDPKRVLCRCCQSVMDRSLFSAKALETLSTFQHALLSDTWEDRRAEPHPSETLLPGEREAWKDLYPTPRAVLA